MDDLKEVRRIPKCLMGRLVKSRMQWAGHIERLDEDLTTTKDGICPPGQGEEKTALDSRIASRGASEGRNLRSGTGEQ